MIAIEPLEDRDFETVARWNEGKPADFIAQWTGPGYGWPLTAAWLIEEHRERNKPGADTYIYRVMRDGEMIGTVQLLKIDREAGSAVAGRFLIGREEDRGKGYGLQALREIVRIGFEEFGLKAVFLSVFDFNKGAIRCYEKAGFETVEFKPGAYASSSGPWGLYRMRITPDKWKGAGER